MEQHPVPQNVTTFQFRLIGDMTLKQFGYLAIGVVVAFICYKLPLPFFFTYPLAGISALLGFGLAFVPVEERPMDVWIMAFLKNVYNPTQWVWQHAKTSPSGPAKSSAAVPTQTEKAQAPPRFIIPAAPASGNPIGELVGRLFAGHPKNTNPEPVPVQPPVAASILSVSSSFSFMDWLKSLFSNKPASLPRSAPAFDDVFAGIISRPGQPLSNHPGNTAAAAGKPPKPDKPPGPPAKNDEVKALEENLTRLKTELENLKGSGDRVAELQKQLTEALSMKDSLSKEIEALRKSAKPTPPPGVFRPAGISTPPSGTAPTVRIIMPDAAVRTGLPRLTTFPNIVTGIIKDSQGNLLSGVLVTARDKNDIPLRALKSNKLGQFAASTPLPNGNYFIEIEDPRGTFTFDRIQVTVNGTIMPPLEIFAKSQKQISRDKLVKEIFGNPKPI